MIDEILKLIKKYKEVILYLIFGALTTVINIVLYAVLYEIGIENLTATAISWFFAVLFAFFTNRAWVFEKKENAFLKECVSFYASRLATLGVDMLIMYIFVDIMSYNNYVMKVFANIIVIVLNYVLSKFFVFKK